MEALFASRPTNYLLIRQKGGKISMAIELESLRWPKMHYFMRLLALDQSGYLVLLESDMVRYGDWCPMVSPRKLYGYKSF